MGLVGSLVAVAGFIVLYQAIDVPDPNKDFETQTTFVYYADGKDELGKFATQNRESITLDEMPDTIKDAVVAAENRTFWTDQGIDPKGIIRAAFSNAKGGSTQGASTITQQYVKILYLTQERTLTRKIKEAFISLKLQRDISKEQILEGYLNTIYFGRGAYGVQAAAQGRTSTSRPRSSTSSSPRSSPASSTTPTTSTPPRASRPSATSRTATPTSSEAMAEEGMVDADEADRAARRLPPFPEIAQESQYGGQRGHVLTMVRKELLRLGYSEEEIEGGGLRVTTTFTKKAMDAAVQGVIEARPDGLQRQAAPHRRRHRRARHRRHPRHLRRPGLPRVPAQLGGRRGPGRLDDEGRGARRGDRGRATRWRTPSRATRRSSCPTAPTIENQGDADYGVGRSRWSPRPRTPSTPPSST